MAGTLFVVATPIGNLDDLSARAVAVLRRVAVVAAEDTRHTAHLLQRFGLSTPTTSLHEHNESAKANDLIDRLEGGQDVAVVSDAGTPTLSDPGQFLVRLAHARGIRVEPIPGPSAIAAALSASGFDASSFVFLGFPPNRGAEREAWFDRVRAAALVAPTLVFYEAPHRIDRTLGELLNRCGDLEVLVGREMTKVHEEVRRAPLSAIVPVTAPKGEYTVVVDVGRMIETTLAEPPGAGLMAEEFFQMTKHGGLTRRQGISALSRKYRISARAVFALLDEAKKSAS